MMKRAAVGLMVPAMIFLGSCGKKEEAKAPEAAPAASEPAVVTPPVIEPPVKPASLSAEERAKMLGFVKHLPQDTEVVMSLHNGSKAASRVKSTKLWKLIETETGMNFGDAPEEETPDGGEAEPSGPSALFGKEFTIALGKPVGEQTAHLLKLNGRSTYFQMRGLAKAFVEAAKSEDFDSLAMLMGSGMNEQLLRDMATDPESGVALFEKMKMPPLYLAFRTTEAGREPAAQQLAALAENLGMFGDEIAGTVEVEKAGHKFTGRKVSGAVVSKTLDENRSDLDEMMDKEMADRFIAAIAQKDLVVLSGIVGDYALLFIGSSADDLVLAEDTGKSLVARDEMAFCDAHASKELAAVIYGRKESLNRMMDGVSGLADITDGLRDGFAGAEGIGDTRDLEALLRMVSEREAALRKLALTDGFGLAAFFDEGLKIECYGGTDNGAIDWDAPNKLASMGNASDVALFLNMTSNDQYDEKSREFVEALMETAYALASKVAGMPIEEGPMLNFKQGFGLFDGKFRPHVVEMWDALGGDFSAGLGGETALIVDLSGTVPPIPGVPQAVADDAKFPRVSMVSSVSDRSKLAASWEQMNVGITGILKEVGGMQGQEIPMQKPVSSERGGFTTWFFPMPFFNDDFMPSVTVGDEWFAASTSKNQALDLLAKAGTGETAKGLRMHVNFAALAKFATETLDVLAKNPDAVPMSPDDMEEVRKLAAALEDFDKLSINVRRENGQLRSSVHFKTR